jgi:Ca-activated chloride channel homolog
VASAREPVETSLEGIDAYFLVDRSGSMTGEKWTKAAEALIEFVKATTESDRVWITFFESGYRDFAEKPLERDALLPDPDFQSIARLGTGGGTEMLPALRHVLKTQKRFSARRRSHIILITDGQVGNEEAVLQAVSRRALPVHCFGIDHAVNEAFLRQLAGQQRGTSVLLTPNDDLVRPIAILGSRLSRPVLTHLTLDKGWELAGSELPDIYAGQVAFASVRKRGRGSDITVAGRDADGRSLTVSLEAQAAETNLPKLIWMKHRIESLLQAGKDGEAIALAEKANLVCRGAAFIAWDDAARDLSASTRGLPAAGSASQAGFLLGPPPLTEQSGVGEKLQKFLEDSEFVWHGCCHGAVDSAFCGATNQELSKSSCANLATGQAPVWTAK